MPAASSPPTLTLAPAVGDIPRLQPPADSPRPRSRLRPLLDPHRRPDGDFSESDAEVVARLLDEHADASTRAAELDLVAGLVGLATYASGDVAAAVDSYVASASIADAERDRLAAYDRDVTEALCALDEVRAEGDNLPGRVRFVADGYREAGRQLAALRTVLDYDGSDELAEVTRRALTAAQEDLGGELRHGQALERKVRVYEGEAIILRGTVQEAQERALRIGAAMNALQDRIAVAVGVGLVLIVAAFVGGLLVGRG